MLKRQCVGYARYSADVPDMLRKQIAILETRAKELDLELLGVFSEISGDTNPPQERPELAKALEMINTHHADYLLVTNLNRITRSELAALYFEAVALKPIGAGLLVCNEATFDFKV